ncbi:hypothetical protein [Candidatus Uabimicrobium sp. HlEnr_7]|uniref:hypothetical protein n=1 Tax=Candidatus Uabimicrobium helgolandensis TaxID=3095367 RepID=UPI003556C817
MKKTTSEKKKYWQGRQYLVSLFFFLFITTVCLLAIAKNIPYKNMYLTIASCSGLALLLCVFGIIKHWNQYSE